MPKYLINHDIGFGPNYQVVDVDNEEAARSHAYDSAKGDFEAQCHWECLGLATPELCEEYGIDVEDDDDEDDDTDDE